MAERCITPAPRHAKMLKLLAYLTLILVSVQAQEQEDPVIQRLIHLSSGLYDMLIGITDVPGAFRNLTLTLDDSSHEASCLVLHFTHGTCVVVGELAE